MKIGNQSFIFDNVYLEEAACTTGPKEHLGPLGLLYDYSFDDLHINEDSWEKAEGRLLSKSIDILLKKSGYKINDIDLYIGGDLINQNIITNYTLRNYDISVVGIYGACSTAILGMVLGSIFISGGNAKKIICGASSHYADAERQFRNPTEYGGPKVISTTSTVTGASTFLLSNIGLIKIKGATLGKVIDVGLNNPNDMGSTMAPAAYDTLKALFNDFNYKPSDFDLILTGDLSKIGAPILDDLFNDLDFTSRHMDAGLMVYHLTDDVFSGGSGCACIGITSASIIYKKLINKEYKRVILCGTGALLNPTIIYQNETIPAIAHAIILERND